MDAQHLNGEQVDEWSGIMPTLTNPMWSAIDNFNPANNTTVIVYDETTNPLPDAIPINGNSFNFQEMPPQAPNELDLMLHNIPPPPTSPGPPDRREFAGELNFSVRINSVHPKKKYLYSAKLNRIYVAECDFPLEFKWDDGPRTPRPAFVRATVVFSDRDQAERRVETCVQHKSQLEKNQRIEEPQLGNVLHSSRDEKSDGVYYCGGGDTWYSTLVKYENNPRSHVYKFICKNSCVGGINRRTICIIFTIEDIHGFVYGRQIVNVRVCACPRRDMRKDEGAEALVPGSEKRESNRRREDCSEARKTKKIKLEVVPEPTTVAGDDEIIKLPSFNARGRQTVIAGYETMIRMMELHQRLSTDAKVVAENGEMIAAMRAFVDSIKADPQ